METRLNILERMYQEEAVKYIAGRYGVTPERIVIQYLFQDRIFENVELPENLQIRKLTPNEMALLRDMAGLTMMDT